MVIDLLVLFVFAMTIVSIMIFIDSDCENFNNLLKYKRLCREVEEYEEIIARRL